jgi:hypothetical protein
MITASVTNNVNTQETYNRIVESALPIWKRGADLIEARAKTNIHNVTGETERSVRSAAYISRDKSQVKGYVRAKALPLEFGTIHMEGRYPLTRARDALIVSIYHELEGRI